MPATMQDIAKSLGVSVVTVSKVLRNKGRISAATRKRVLRRAKELNYQTNWIARSLVTRKTYTLGLLLPDFTHPIFAEIAKAIAESVRPHDYRVIIAYFEEDPELEETEVNSLLARQVDGLFVATAHSRPDLFADIVKRKVPLVMIDRSIPRLHASFVGSDNEAIGRIATNHLIEQGCRRIAHLRGPDLRIADDRFAGYRSALKKHGMTMPSRYVAAARYLDSSGYAGMRRLLETAPRPDGVFCYNDPVAIGAIKAICEADLQVPRDVAVVGAGNVRYSDVLTVPLTTVDQDTEKIGRCAAELLLEQINGKGKSRVKTVRVPPKLIPRQSSQRRF